MALQHFVLFWKWSCDIIHTNNQKLLSRHLINEEVTVFHTKVLCYNLLRTFVSVWLAFFQMLSIVWICVTKSFHFDFSALFLFFTTRNLSKVKQILRTAMPRGFSATLYSRCAGSLGKLKIFFKKIKNHSLNIIYHSWVFIVGPSIWEKCDRVWDGILETCESATQLEENRINQRSGLALL